MSRRGRWNQMQTIDQEALEGEIVDMGLPSADPLRGLSGLGFSISDVTNLFTGASQKALDKVKSEAGKGAEEAVIKQIKTNSVHIMIFAVTAGALGGLLAQRTGFLGSVVMTSLAVWSGWKIMNVGKGAK